VRRGREALRAPLALVFFVFLTIDAMLHAAHPRNS